MLSYVFSLLFFIFISHYTFFFLILSSCMAKCIQHSSYKNEWIIFFLLDFYFLIFFFPIKIIVSGDVISFFYLVSHWWFFDISLYFLMINVVRFIKSIASTWMVLDISKRLLLWLFKIFKIIKQVKKNFLNSWKFKNEACYWKWKGGKVCLSSLKESYTNKQMKTRWFLSTWIIFLFFLIISSGWKSWGFLIFDILKIFNLCAQLAKWEGGALVTFKIPTRK